MTNSLTSSREKLEAEALRLWRSYGRSYTSGPRRYKVLRWVKRTLKIGKMSKVDKITLEDYPDVPFLKLRGEEEVRTYLDNLNDAELAKLVKDIKNIINYDYSYKTVSSFANEFNRQIQSFGAKTTHCGVNPDSIGSTGKKGRNRSVVEH